MEDTKSHGSEFKRLSSCIFLPGSLYPGLKLSKRFIANDFSKEIGNVREDSLVTSKCNKENMRKIGL